MDIESFKQLLGTTALALALKILAALAFWFIGRWLIGRVVWLILRPFKVGDFVSVGGVVGTFHELGQFGTTIVTPDNVMTLVGNGKVFGDTIQNFSAMPVRRVERTAQLAGGVDARDAIERLRAAVAKIPNVAAEPKPEVSCST